MTPRIALVAGAAALLALGPIAAGPAWADPAAPPPDYRAPSAAGLCPALVDDYELCAGDLWSGDCADFVAHAARLGESYRAEVRAHPDWADELRSTIWWGCGSADLAQLRALLERIGSPQARAVMAAEPYRSLVRTEVPAAAEPDAAAPPGADCEAPASEAERAACAARALAAAKAHYQQFFGACREQVGPDQRPELLDGERSWEGMLSLECAGTGSTRDSCLARAYQERARSLSEMHPECAARAR
jgi:hypothetical protein